MARIGPDKNDLMEIEYYDDADLKAVCNGKYPFVRILSEGAYPVSDLPRFENLDI